MVRDTPMVHNERTKRKKQKRGFPIKNFGNDGGDGFLNGSTRNLKMGGDTSMVPKRKSMDA